MSSNRSASRRLSLAAFTAWLYTKHERTKIGAPWEADSCPLAKFLTQTTGVPYQVSGDTHTYEPAKFENGKIVKDVYGNVKYDMSKSVDLPAWANHFISIVDEGDEGDKSSVSAKRARRIAESSTLGRAARM